ncbi:hypothetical protein [Amycolatopsis samaneae]|uniref:Uncharacterized protein n=1 Tax=Amycolatopsis samaneae TaxID=664691 RepID=A0ABW5G9U5_9PSEU
MEVQLVVIVLAIAVVLIGGTMFSAWRADRVAERERTAKHDDEATP